MIPELIAQYVDTGKVRFVYREFPLSSIHPFAQKASEAAICAGEQGSYWEMNEHLFASQGEWAATSDPTDSFKSYAKELGLDTAEFDRCLDSGEAAVVVQGDSLVGQQLGVNATPYFFINDIPVRGGLPIEALGRIIDYVAVGGTQPEIIPADGDWHMRGNTQTAQALTVAFVDFASPASAQHALEVLPQLMDAYVDGGQMLYILHPWSEAPDSTSAQAAGAAECAGQQEKYWEMHDQLFADQEAWSEAAEPRSLFAGYAESLGLDVTAFETCLDSDSTALRVEAGSVVAALYGVPGAPIYLFNNGEALEDAASFEEFQTMIDSILNPQP